MKPVIVIAIIAGAGFMLYKGKKIGSSVIDIIIGTMADAIQEFEGWYPESRSFRNNNPGNLRWFNGAGTIPWSGATGLDAENHVVFDTYENGRMALAYQLTLAFTGRSRVYSLSDTLYDFFGKYAEGNQVAYAESVAARLGVSANATLASLIGFQN